KNWQALEDVFKEVERRDFARLTAEVAETFGKCARFCTPEDFEAQYKVMSKHIITKAPYFNAVYEAYRAESYEHARRAAKIALARWPDDENMKRESIYLEELIAARKK